MKKCKGCGKEKKAITHRMTLVIRAMDPPFSVVLDKAVEVCYTCALAAKQQFESIDR